MFIFLPGCGYYYHHGYIRPSYSDYDQYYRHYHTYPSYNQWDYNNRRFMPTWPPMYNNNGIYRGHKHDSPPNTRKKKEQINNNWNRLNPKFVPEYRYRNSRPAMPMR